MAVTSQRVQQKNVALNTVVMSVLSNTAGTSSMFNTSAPVPNFFKQYFQRDFHFSKLASHILVSLYMEWAISNDGFFKSFKITRSGTTGL